MKNLILFSSVALASGLFFVNLYNSMVDAKSWGADLPNSIAAARDYFKVANPGNFFRLFSPINQVLALLSLLLFWKAFPGGRIYLGAALIMFVAADIMTFAYFYPRNDIMFTNASLQDTSALQKAWSEWNNMNWIRTLVLLVGICCSFLFIHKFSSRVESQNATVKTSTREAVGLQ
jgi:uncharacterized membrane protein